MKHPIVKKEKKNENHRKLIKFSQIHAYKSKKRMLNLGEGRSNMSNLNRVSRMKSYNFFEHFQWYTSEKPWMGNESSCFHNQLVVRDETLTQKEWGINCQTDYS